MNDKIKVFSSQYSNFFGNNQIHFPYSIASLVSFCLTDGLIKEKFQFEKTFLFKTGIETDIAKAFKADILMCSCYCWNWQITKLLAKKVKEVNKNCLVIFGGPEVPKCNNDNFFSENEEVDIIVNGEGELVLRDILLEYSKGVNLESLKISGIKTKFHTAPPKERIEDLNIIPSPYSTNLIWDLVEKRDDINYIVSWETNRGCPFSCTFCDWGSSTMSKVRNFSEEKVFKEVEWFGENKIKYIDCCDGNFGIFQERDYNIAKKLVEVKALTGFPDKLNLTWVKTSSEKVIPTAKLLADAQMLRAVSLSVQSLDQKTLDAIKRKNLKFNNFEDLIKKFSDEGIQSYTEMIMGLPEETVESFKNNWEILAAINPQPSIMVWNCSVFVNAPMNDPNYIKKYGIEVFTSPIFMSHSAKNTNEIKEFEKMVRATNTLPNGKISEVYLFNWIMMVFHVFGVLEFVSRYYNKHYGISFVKFYETLIEFCKTQEGSFGREFKNAQNKAKEGYSGNGWDFYDDELGDISWPVEEAGWLKLVRSKEGLVSEINNFLIYFHQKMNINPDEEQLQELIRFQLMILSLPEERALDKIENSFNYDWLTYFSNKNVELKKEENTLIKHIKIKEQDIIKWGFEAAWFGRRAHKYKMKLKEIIKK